MTSLVSIIIPVYNVEKYIEKCMQSLLDQTYKNFEALIVNDGSPDNSIAIAKSLVGNDPRFIFFDKENGGQGSARNLALENAKGNYIAFLDSDDYYDNEYISIMLEKIIEEDCDICICNLNYVDMNYEHIRVFRNDLPAYFLNKDYLMTYRSLTNFMWDKLFKAHCFEGIRFDPLIKTYEDVHLIFKVLYGRKITSVYDVLYNYVQRPNSTVNSIPMTYIEDRYSIYTALERFYKSHLHQDNKFEKDLRYYFLYNFIHTGATKIVQYSEDYESDISKLLSKDNNDEFTIKNIIVSKAPSAKSKLAILMLKIDPRAYKILMTSRLKLEKDENI